MTYMNAMGPPQAAPPPPAPRRRVGGPVTLMVIGAVVIIGAVVAGASSMKIFASSFPTSMLSGDLGPDALSTGTAPGRAQVSTVAGSEYVVWAVSDDGTAFGRDDVAVECGGGHTVLVTTPDASGNAYYGEVSSWTVAQFTSPSDGECTVTVDASSTQHATFIVAEATDLAAEVSDTVDFVNGFGSSVVLTIVSVGGGLVGTGLFIGGLVWLLVRITRPPVPR